LAKRGDGYHEEFNMAAGDSDPAHSALNDPAVDQAVSQISTLIESVAPAGSPLQFVGVLASTVLRLWRMNTEIRRIGTQLGQELDQNIRSQDVLLPPRNHPPLHTLDGFAPGGSHHLAFPNFCRALQVELDAVFAPESAGAAARHWVDAQYPERVLWFAQDFVLPMIEAGSSQFEDAQLELLVGQSARLERPPVSKIALYARFARIGASVFPNDLKLRSTMTDAYAQQVFMDRLTAEQVKLAGLRAEAEASLKANFDLLLKEALTGAGSPLEKMVGTIKRLTVRDLEGQGKRIANDIENLNKDIALAETDLSTAQTDLKTQEASVATLEQQVADAEEAERPEKQKLLDAARKKQQELTVDVEEKRSARRRLQDQKHQLDLQASDITAGVTKINGAPA
jgi:hypothetical protein